MPDDLDDELAEWGRSATPPVDGAFANRLETSLRSGMLDRSSNSGAWWAAAVFRPGVVVMAIALLIFGFAFVAGGSDEVGFADDSTTTLPISTTSVIDLTTTTRLNVAPDVPPITGTSIVGPDDSASTTAPPAAPNTTDGAPTDQTTNAPTTVPVTTDPPITTIPDTATTVAPAPQPISELTARRDGRQMVISWRVDTTRSDVAGWVLLREIDREPLEISRDPATRRFVTPITDVDADYRLEGRTADGDVVFDSGVILFSPGG